MNCPYAISPNPQGLNMTEEKKELAVIFHSGSFDRLYQGF
jgi:hypothetical protein